MISPQYVLYKTTIGSTTQRGEPAVQGPGMVHKPFQRVESQEGTGTARYLPTLTAAEKLVGPGTQRCWETNKLFFVTVAWEGHLHDAVFRHNKLQLQNNQQTGN